MASFYINDNLFTDKEISDKLKQFFIDEFPERVEILYNNIFRVNYLTLETTKAEKMFQIIISDIKNSNPSFWTSIASFVKDYKRDLNFAKFFNKIFELIKNNEDCSLFFQLLLLFKNEGIDLIYKENEDEEINVKVHFPLEMYIEIY